MKIKFYGSANMVTGSNHMIEVGDKKLLLDCGMFQGGAEEELLNFEDFSFNPSEIDYLVLSHAHIDHSGRIPRLTKQGFKGRILTTKATYDLCNIMLLDSAHIQETDMEWENKKRERAGKPLLEPLYTSEDVIRSLNLFEKYYYDQYIKIDDIFTLRFLDAGHILGSSIVELWINEDGKSTKLVYSGDLGVGKHAIIKEPKIVESADYLILESTYGDRIHENYEEVHHKLIDIIEKTASRGGAVVIPSFAVGRTQELIYQLNSYYDSETMEAYKRIPIYIDSPLAIQATEAYQKNAELFNDETKKRILSGDNPFEFPNLRYVGTVEESKSLNKSPYPKVIISASGMADAGRIRHHLKHHLWDPRNTILFVGYQAIGSTGRKILDGAKTIKILGEEIIVRAEIKELQGLSAHADLNMILNWVGNIREKPKKIFLVHGEPNATENLKKEIQEKYNISTRIARLGEVIEIDSSREKIHIDRRKEVDLSKNLNDSINQVKELFNVYESQRKSELDDEFVTKHYSEYNEALLDIKNRLMELLMLENK
ncbi:MAG: MBL fold metallo-hydrolase [Tissierellia bacterium]|nr:MBL fold metallo-hydrolase [Tissierellia bacterium]